MSEYKITVESGSTVRLVTAGKYCDRDILVTVTGSTNYTVTDIDYSGWDSGSFKETLDNGATLEYAVEFDNNGRPIKVTALDGTVTTVNWDNAPASTSTFTIDGIEMLTNPGMTWGEWLNTPYNVISHPYYTWYTKLGINRDGHVALATDYDVRLVEIRTVDHVAQTANDVIVEDYMYETYDNT